MLITRQQIQEIYMIQKGIYEFVLIVMPIFFIFLLSAAVTARIMSSNSILSPTFGRKPNLLINKPANVSASMPLKILLNLFSNLLTQGWHPNVFYAHDLDKVLIV